MNTVIPKTLIAFKYIAIQTVHASSLNTTKQVTIVTSTEILIVALAIAHVVVVPAALVIVYIIVPAGVHIAVVQIQPVAMPPWQQRTV